MGYNSSAKVPYYIVKNSWGEDWGEGGFVRMQMGQNLDCIACKACFPIGSKTSPQPGPVPEVACPAGTYDEKHDEGRACPQGSSCCCSHKSVLEKKCKRTECCLSGVECRDGHGCEHNKTLF